MDIDQLMQMVPWSLPEEASEKALEAILDRDLPVEKRIRAVSFSGEITVMDDAIAEALIDMAEDDDEAQELRGSALISLGTMLAQAELVSYDDDDDGDGVPAETVESIRQRMREVHDNESMPKLLRRRALEGSARYHQDWHPAAIRAAYNSGDDEWRLTAVFCMVFVPGFEEEIKESLKSDDDLVFLHAIEAAGNFGVKEAWPHIETILEDHNPNEGLLYAAIGAAPMVNSLQAVKKLKALMLSDDEDLAFAAEEALHMAGIASPLDDSVDLDF